MGAVISAGVTLESSERCVQIAYEYAAVFAGVGIHPEDMTGPLSNEDLDRVRKLAADPRVVVMSEVGLDHTPPEPFRTAPGPTWQPSTGPEWWRMQEEAFRAQVGIAREHGLAVVFHNRVATEDTLRVLSDERVGQLGGAAHYFQGDWAYAKSLLDLGLHISFAKPLLRSPQLQQVARRAPFDRIVLETDSFPQTYKADRAKWTEPGDIPLIASTLAGLRKVAAEEVRERTTENALQMMGRRGAPLRACLSAYPTSA